MIANLTTTQTTNSMAKETEEQKKGLKFSPNKVKEVIERETKKRTDARKGGVEALKQKNEHKIGTSNGYMKTNKPMEKHYDEADRFPRRTPRKTK